MSELSKTIKKEKSERILTFDLLRGYFLCVILFDHLGFYPSGLDFFTGRGSLYASTAEGFFVVSGIVLGIVRGRKLINQPFRVAAKLLWKRALQLYLTSITLTFFFTLVGQLFIGNAGLKWGIFTDWVHWWDLLYKTITLSYTYSWADFLRLYAIFLVFAPLALWFLRKGWWYVMLAISVVVWSLYPYLPQDPIIAQPFSWQLIFFGGLTIGFYWETTLSTWRKLSIRLRKTIGWSVAGLFAITVVTSFLLVFGHELGGAVGAQLDAIHQATHPHFHKDRLSLERILIGTVWFWGLFYLFRRFEKVIVRRAGWLLLGFGTNSLYVYTISAFVVFFAHLIVNPPGFGVFILNLLASLLALAIVQLAVQTKFLMKIIPR